VRGDGQRQRQPFRAKDRSEPSGQVLARQPALRRLVVEREGEADLGLDDLKAFLKSRLGKHEMIAALQLVDQLPRTPVGKIDKKPLYAAEAAADV